VCRLSRISTGARSCVAAAVQRQAAVACVSAAAAVPRAARHFSTADSAALHRTALYDEHVKLGGKMVRWHLERWGEQRL